MALDGIKWVCRRFTLKNLGKFAYGNTVNGTCHLYCYKLTGVNFLCGGGITFKGEANKHSSLGAFAGYKFEQIMTSNNPKELEKPINRHCAFYRLVHTNIGNKPVLLSAEMDCQDSEGNYLELKLVRENEDFNRFHSKLRDTVIQCQLAGVERIVLGKYRWLQKQQPQLISTKEIDTKQVEEGEKKPNSLLNC